MGGYTANGEDGEVRQLREEVDQLREEIEEFREEVP